MPASGKKLYIAALFILIVGYLWIFVHSYTSFPQEGYVFCFFKHITGVPCPACGSTRSVLSFFHGEIKEAAAYNPLGIVSGLLMIVLLPWILYDIILRKDSFYRAFLKTENLFKKKYIFIPAILLVISIWIWNIARGI